MLKTQIASFLILISIFIKPLEAKEPSKLITEIVNEASMILSSSDPVESKIIKLNNIAETNVDIDGIGMYTLGKYRKILSEDQKIKYNKLFKSYFLKSFSSRLVDYSNPKIKDAYKNVINACKKYGKTPGMGGVYNEELMSEYISIGMKFILSGSDLSFMMASASQRSNKLRSFQK